MNAFVVALPLAGSSRDQFCIGPSKSWLSEERFRSVPNRTHTSSASIPLRMIQSPGSDGPPDLSEFFKRNANTTSAPGNTTKEIPPCTLGTGRASTKSHGGDAAAAATAAVKKALGALSNTPQLAHVTFALDVDSAAAVGAIRKHLADDTVPIMGRSVAKKDNEGIIEVVVLHSGAGMGIQVGTMNVAAKIISGGEDDPVGAVDAACREATRAATMSALTRLPPEYPPEFLIFANSAGAREGVARGAIAAAVGGRDIAYGGAAAGDADGYTLIAPGVNDCGKTREVNNQVAVVAAVPGKISFLLSSVVKNWTQPKFIEALDFMTPNYVDNPEEDLLTAIRYDDWDKFIYCIEERGVDVNHKWAKKQNQIPLLAACGRLRTKMVEYLIQRGADVHHRNDGAFTAAMYTHMLIDTNKAAVEAQLKMLEDAGANIVLDQNDEARLKKATSGRMGQ